MINVSSDMSVFYADFGMVAPVDGKDNIVAMVDETLELDESDGLTLRTFKSAGVEARDIVTVNGYRFRVMRVTPYGDVDEEKILTLRKEMS